jgi:hypothetical protein
MTAKQRFQASDFVKGWNDLVDSKQFEFAADMAVLQLMETLPIMPDQAGAAANEYRRQGAILFLQILQNLASNPKMVQPERSGELKYNR